MAVNSLAQPQETWNIWHNLLLFVIIVYCNLMTIWTVIYDRPFWYVCTRGAFGAFSLCSRKSSLTLYALDSGKQCFTISFHPAQLSTLFFRFEFSSNFSEERKSQTLLTPIDICLFLRLNITYNFSLVYKKPLAIASPIFCLTSGVYFRTFGLTLLLFMVYILWRFADCNGIP